jgi:hypothetical protein
VIDEVEQGQIYRAFFAFPPGFPHDYWKLLWLQFRAHISVEAESDTYRRQRGKMIKLITLIILIILIILMKQRT